MGVNHIESESVYCDIPIETRSQVPLYQAVRKYIIANSPQGTILDLGSGDLPAEFGLPNKSMGLDLSIPALNLANSNGHRGLVAQVDLEKSFPIKDIRGNIETVLILDFLEHLPPHTILSLLRAITTNLPHRPLDILVSMPVISPLSVRTWIEYAQLVKNLGVRPKIGLFDQTHQTLTNREGHKKLFAQAGLSVKAEAYTCWQGVVGDNALDINSGIRGKKSKLVGLFTETIFPNLIHPFNSAKRNELNQQLNEYQALYCLQPKN